MSDIRDQAREELKRSRIEAVLRTIECHNSCSPITGAAVARITGLSNAVAVRMAVNTLRREGTPICSSIDGYWIGELSSELQIVIDDLNGRISAVLEAIKGLEYARQAMLSNELGNISQI